MIRPTILRAKGVTILEPLNLDLRGLGPLIAVVGENWAGKTSLIELFPGALYKRFPSRAGHMHDSCVGKAEIELEFEDGPQTILIQHKINAGVRTQSHIFDITNGQQVPLTEGRDAEFKAEIQRRLFSYELFTSSNFLASKGKSGFATQAVLKRKQLFAEILQLDQIEEANSRCTSFIKLTVQESDKAHASIQGITSTIWRNISPEFTVFVDAGDLKAICVLQKIAIHGLNIQAEMLRAQLENSESLLEAARGEALSLKQQIQGIINQQNSLGLERSSLLLKHQAAKANLALPKALEPNTVSRLRARLEAVSKILNQEPQILDAQIREQNRITREAVLREQIADIETSSNTLCSALDEAQRGLQAERVLDGQRAAKTAQAALLDEVPCTEARVWTNASFADDDEYDRELSSLCPLLAAGRQAALDLETIQVSQTDQFSSQIQEIRAQQAILEQEKSTLTLELQTVLRAKQVDSGLLAQASQIESARSEKDFLETQIRETLKSFQEQQDHERRVLETEFQALDIRLNEIQALAASLEQEIASLKTSLSSTGINNLETRVSELVLALDKAQRQVQKLHSELTLTNRAVDDLENLKSQERDLSVSVKDWELLSYATSRNGLQALKIASAGPEVSAIANRFLSACYGSHFDLQFRTLAQTKAGKEREDFDIIVNINGRETSLDDMSDGEGILVGEGASLAIAHLNAQKNSTRFSVLFRDETVGGLSLTNAAMYVNLLRIVLQEGIFEKCMFISHQPQIYEQADSRIYMENGRIARIE